MTIDLSLRPKPQQCRAIIESKTQLTKTVWLVNFRMQNPPEIRFLPGQTISLHVGEGLNRSMSIASAPDDGTHILMCHDVSPGGPGSQWTLNHTVGDVATFMAPLGIFILDKTSNRKKVLVATGTGIAPFRSMLLDGITQPVTLYWGLRHEKDVYWNQEFEEFAHKHPNFIFKLTLSKPDEHWIGLKGRVTDHVLQEENDVTESEFYLCGNKEMVIDMEMKLLTKGIPKKQVYKELYF